MGYETDGLVILRAIGQNTTTALTASSPREVDWNNHVGQKHHFDNARFGDIRYTEPFSEQPAHQRNPPCTI